MLLGTVATARRFRCARESRATRAGSNQVMRLRLLALGIVTAAVGLTPPAARATWELDAIARGLGSGDIYVGAAVSPLVDAPELRRGAAIASRAADGARIKLAFVNVSDAQLDSFRERLFGALDLGSHGALVVATPVSITMRTKTLTPAAEHAIIAAAAFELRAPPRDYTAALAELLYDTGLVIHNSTPGAVPRGNGPNSDLRTFTGRFEGEDVGARYPWPFVALVEVGAAAGAAAAAARRRRRLNRG